MLHSFCSFFLLVISFGVVSANDTPPLLTRFESTYRSARTLQVLFLERYFENGALIRAESGTAYFRKPGKMRWEYEKPEKNLFLVDGKNAWFYTPVDHTATRIPARQSDDRRTPLALLAGEGKLSRICDRVLPATLPSLPQSNLSEATGTGFECILKNSAQIVNSGSPDEAAVRVLLEISATGELRRVLIDAPGSLQTEFRFKDWVVNPTLAEAMFHFSPPPGVVIVDGLAPSARRQ
jgi:outer membrane lipoprotein carrier protein